MKFIRSTAILLAFMFGAALAPAQINGPNTKFQHVIIIIQENRTPDNLFGSDASSNPNQLVGADLATQGQCELTQNPVPLANVPLGTTCNPNHWHTPGWVGTFDGGKMDGACTIGAHSCSDLKVTYP